MYGAWQGSPEELESRDERLSFESLIIKPTPGISHNEYKNAHEVEKRAFTSARTAYEGGTVQKEL